MVREADYRLKHAGKRAWVDKEWKPLRSGIMVMRNR